MLVLNNATRTGANKGLKYSNASFFVIIEGACSVVKDDDLEEEATFLFQKEEVVNTDEDVDD
jgi:hypothetical protein